VSESFQERLRRLQAERAEKPLAVEMDSPGEDANVKPVRPLTPVPVATVEHDADLIPEVEPGYEHNEDDDEIDRLVDSIDILEAYRRWCGKMEPNPRGKRESIMVSCPKPEHPDKNPSAWINLDKETWFCGSCNEGGDKFDIAAYHHGFDVPGYKDGKNFPDLRRRIAEDLGYVIKRTLGGKEYIERIEIESDVTDDAVVEDPKPVVEHDAKPDAKGAKGDDEPTAAVLHFPVPDDFEDEELLEYPTIDWYAVTPPDSFLRRWMEATSGDDLPDEFYFWLGMQAIGLAVGRDTVLSDSPAVNANLFICLFGPSGQGKSRAQRALTELLREALPYDPDDPASSGTYLVPSPGSAESLVDAFSKPIYDPTDPKKLIGHSPVRGLVRFDELATLTGRGSRAGSVMKPTLMSFFDGERIVELKSRGAGHAIANLPFASCVTSTQPRAVRDLLVASDADSGFLNRWIFACGRDKVKVSFGRRRIDITECVDLLRKIRAWSSSVDSIGLTDEAFKVWDEFFHSTLEPSRAEEEESLLTRTDLHLKKIMLLLAIDRGERNVSAATATDAISMWEYLRRSYKMLGGDIGMGPLEDAHQYIIGAMRNYQTRHKRAISRRELRNLLKRKKIALENYARVLKLMQEVGEIEEVISKTDGGKKVARYRVVNED